MDRRMFLKSCGLLGGATVWQGCTGARSRGYGKEKTRPNMLWITCEDISCWLGCWGDDFADSPNIDALAAKGTRYTKAFATAPVCAPSRSCLVTGVYATSLGTQHLRSAINLPAEIRCFTQYLREAGYHCSNNSKKDYNFQDVGAWDESSEQAHWRNRKAGQPFFSVFNFTTTHQSQINGTDEFWNNLHGHKLTADERHDPAKVKLPPYYPDSPIVRKMFARYYDLITLMDRQVGEILGQLEEDGLAEDTIVFFYSDHGSGIPRHKRVLYDTGLNVPLVVYFPEKYRHLAPTPRGRATDRLVSFVDFAPTVLSMAGLEIPDYMQGTAFLGDKAGKARTYIYGAASRVDEAYEMSRCVRDKRYKYIRNYLPHLPLIQRSAYCDKAEIMCELRRLLAEGKMNKVQEAMWRRKPAEEFYDTQEDPLELNNLVGSASHAKIIGRLKDELRNWTVESRDTGLMSEAEMLIRSAGSTPFETARDGGKFPIEEVLAAAELVGTTDIDAIKAKMSDKDAAIRYWAMIAATYLADIGPLRESLNLCLTDASPNVRFAAAGLLAGRGLSSDAVDILAAGLDEEGVVTLYAARELEMLGDGAKAVVEKMDAARAANYSSKRNVDYRMFIDWALTEALRNCGVETDYLVKF